MQNNPARPRRLVHEHAIPTDALARAGKTRESRYVACDHLNRFWAELRARLVAHIDGQSELTRPMLADLLAGGTVDTAEAEELLRAIGYDARRKLLDGYLRRGLLVAPRGVDHWHMAWSLDSMVEYGMLLERGRHWLPGFHDEKKSCWERQAERDLGLEVRR